MRRYVHPTGGDRTSCRLHWTVYQFLRVFPNSPLAGKAYLDRGWCEWACESTAKTKLVWPISKPPRNVRSRPEGLWPVARFEPGDAMFALTNYAGALENYRAVIDHLRIFQRRPVR